MVNGFLRSNIDRLDINRRLALSHITGGLGISGEMAKTTTRNKLIMLLARNIPQTTSEKNKQVIRKRSSSDKQYLSPPGNYRMSKVFSLIRAEESRRVHLGNN